MNKHLRKPLGYASIAIGILLILIAIDIVNSASTQVTNAFWISFYSSAPAVISFCFIEGAVFVVIGAVFLRNIRNKWSYASIIVGFSLIAAEATELVVALQNDARLRRPGGLGGWSAFQQQWSLPFFSVLMTACFLITLGIIVGLKVRGKLGYVSIAGGLAFILFGLSILMLNFEDNNYLLPDWHLVLQKSWNLLISFLLIIGALFVIIGSVYLLLMLRHRKTANLSK